MPFKEAQRHHYIPQVILKNFADADEQIWFWRHGFEPGKVVKTGVKNLFVEKDLYTLMRTDGSKDIALERNFAKQDEIIGSLLREVIPATRAGSRIKFNSGAMRAAHLFIYFLTKRSPGYLETLARETGLDDELRRKLDGLAETDPSVGEAGQRVRIAHNAMVFAQAQIPSDEVLKVYSNLGVVIYRVADPMDALVIGDVPGTVAGFGDTMENGPEKLAFYPVAHDIALGFVRAPGQVEQIELSSAQVAIMNAATATRSWTVAGSSKEILAFLRERVTYVGPQSDPEHPDWNGA